MDRIICVVGPTASGKTKLAVQLAKLYGGEVVSCDSMQIYKHMDIGTAKPTKEEMEGVHHHLLDMVEPGEDFSAGKYVQLADSCVQDIYRAAKPPSSRAARGCMSTAHRGPFICARPADRQARSARGAAARKRRRGHAGASAQH